MVRKKAQKFDPALTLCYQSENGEQVNEPAGRRHGPFV